MSAHNRNWHVQVKEEDQNFTNTCIEQIEDPLKAIMVKNKKTHLAETSKYHRKHLSVKRFVALKSEVHSIVHYIIFIQTTARLRGSESP